MPRGKGENNVARGKTNARWLTWVSESRVAIGFELYMRSQSGSQDGLRVAFLADAYLPCEIEWKVQVSFEAAFASRELQSR